MCPKGTGISLARSRPMGPREEDNTILLLGAVGLICALIAFVPALFEPTPASAGTAAVADAPSVDAMPPARVIVPFTPNTTPGER